MRLKLSRNITGVNGQSGKKQRVHARAGEFMKVLLLGTSYYVCDSNYYPGESAIVFPSQIEEKVIEPKTLEELEFEEQLEYGFLSEQTE